MQIHPYPVPRPATGSGRHYRLFGLLALLLIGLGVSIALHWNERLYFHLTHQWNVSAHDPALRWLPGYRVAIDARPIEGISRNLVYTHTYIFKCIYEYVVLIIICLKLSYLNK